MTTFSHAVCDNTYMPIYIDVFIFTNMFEDLLFLLSVRRILSLKASLRRLTIASVLGGAAGLTAFLNFPFLINILIKISNTALLTFAAFGFKNKKIFLKSVSVLLALTFLFSGAMICFWLALRPNGMIIVNDAVYFNISPAVLIILTLVIYLLLFLFRKLFKNHGAAHNYVEISIRIQEEKYRVKCKVDSGLNAREPFSGSKVIIVEKSMFPNTIFSDKKLRAVPFESLGGKGILFAFKPREITIEGKQIGEEIYIAMSDGVFRNEYKGLVPENLLRS